MIERAGGVKCILEYADRTRLQILYQTTVFNFAEVLKVEVAQHEDVSPQVARNVNTPWWEGEYSIFKTFQLTTNPYIRTGICS